MKLSDYGDFAKEKIYSIEDLFYIQSYQKQIQKNFNLLVWFTKNSNKNFSFRELASKHKIDHGIYKSMQEIGYLDENFKILVKPSLGTATALALYHRNKKRSNLIRP